jgi:hypothetical protein
MIHRAAACHFAHHRQQITPADQILPSIVIAHDFVGLWLIKLILEVPP